MNTTALLPTVALTSKGEKAVSGATECKERLVGMWVGDRTRAMTASSVAIDFANSGMWPAVRLPETHLPLTCLDERIAFCSTSVPWFAEDMLMNLTLEPGTHLLVP